MYRGSRADLVRSSCSQKRSISGEYMVVSFLAWYFSVWCRNERCANCACVGWLWPIARIALSFPFPVILIHTSHFHFLHFDPSVVGVIRPSVPWLCICCLVCKKPATDRLCKGVSAIAACKRFLCYRLSTYFSMFSLATFRSFLHRIQWKPIQIHPGQTASTPESSSGCSFSVSIFERSR